MKTISKRARTRTYTLDPQDIGFATNQRKLEAYRRSLEIRGFSEQRRQTGQVEHFSWVTPTRFGTETEEVSVDTRSGLITYRLTVMPLNSGVGA